MNDLIPIALPKSWLKKIPFVDVLTPQARWADGSAVTRLAEIRNHLELAIEYKGTLWIVDLSQRKAQIRKADPKTL